MQRRILVLLLLGIIIVVGCIVITVVLSQKNKYDEFEDTFIFNVNTSSYNNRLYSDGIDLDKVPSIDRKLFYDLNSECGEVLEDRIIDGQFRLFGYTWTAGLEYGCGGSLISDRYVLTAASCITNKERGLPTRVILGVRNIVTTDEDCRPLFGEEVCAQDNISVDIERIDVHPNWFKQKFQFYDDLALIRLAKPIKYNYIQTICLPNESYVPKNQTKFVVAGWSLTQDGNMIGNVKLQISLPLFRKELCIRRLNRYIKDGQICAGIREGVDTCLGDGGGPLMVLELGTWSIVGLVSMGSFRCGRESFPSVYTFIPKYLDWIFEKMKP